MEAGSEAQELLATGNLPTRALRVAPAPLTLSSGGSKSALRMW